MAADQWPTGRTEGSDSIEKREIFLTGEELKTLLDEFNVQHDGIIERHEEAMGQDFGGTKQVMNFVIRLKGFKGAVIFHQETKDGRTGYCIAIPDQGGHYTFGKYQGPIDEAAGERFQRTFLEWYIARYKSRN